MHRFFRPSMRLATLVLATLFAAPVGTRLLAQGPQAPVADSAVVVGDSAAASAANTARPGSGLSGAPMVGLRSAVHTRETARPLTPTAAPSHANLGQSQAMMVVGAAALITGAIIGGDPGTIIMVGGAIIGLYGLYQYLQ